MEIIKSKISAVSLISLVASAIAIAFASLAPVTSLHHRAYSVAMCVVYLASSSYLGHRSGADPVTAILKTMSGRKAAVVAVGATCAMTLVFAVNGKERIFPAANARAYLLIAAIVSATASLASASSATPKTGHASRPSSDAATGTKLAGMACLLVVIAISSTRQTAILFAQAFVFGIAAVAAWMTVPDSLSSPPATHSTVFSRTSSSATLAVHGEQEADNGFPDKRQKGEGDSNVENGQSGNSEPDTPTHQSAFERLPSVSGERWRMACIGILLLPMLAWMGRHAAVMVGAAGEETMSIKSFGWPREADYDMYVLCFQPRIKANALDGSVVAYYDEDKAILKETIASVKRGIRKHHTTRTIVYAKGPDSHTWKGLDGLRKAVGADEVVALKNVGREGETYLVSSRRIHEAAELDAFAFSRTTSHVTTTPSSRRSRIRHSSSSHTLHGTGSFPLASRTLLPMQRDSSRSDRT